MKVIRELFIIYSMGGCQLCHCLASCSSISLWLILQCIILFYCTPWYKSPFVEHHSAQLILCYGMAANVRWYGWYGNVAHTDTFSNYSAGWRPLCWRRWLVLQPSHVTHSPLSLSNLLICKRLIGRRRLSSVSVAQQSFQSNMSSKSVYSSMHSTCHCHLIEFV